MNNELDQLALKHGTDQSSAHHNYTEQFALYFAPLRNKPVKLLELGWGGHENPDDGGKSALVWRDYFRAGTIVSIDNETKVIDPNKFRGINFHQMSQDDKAGLTELTEKYGRWDIIIDDASHLSSLTLKSFDILWPNLKPGGWYVIEDIHSSYHAWYYGLAEANPNPNENGTGGPTAMNFLKSLADQTNWDLLEQEYRWLGDVETVHFYKDIVFIRKKG